MPTPNINVTNGAVQGTLVHGQPFWWWNPTSATVVVSNCGNFCLVNAYEVPANGYTAATVSINPNQATLAFTTTASVPGQPHVQNPITVDEDEPDDLDEVKDVA